MSIVQVKIFVIYLIKINLIKEINYFLFNGVFLFFKRSQIQQVYLRNLTPRFLYRFLFNDDKFFIQCSGIMKVLTFMVILQGIFTTNSTAMLGHMCY